MNIDIYRSTKNGTKYLSVPFGTDIKTFSFPADLDPDLHALSIFKTALEIDPGNPRVALDAEDVLNQIAAKGFAVHGATITIREGGTA